MSISLIILTKNRALLLEKNLGSLAGQTKKPSEIIIIDNNSQDTTQEIIQNYSKRLPVKSIITKISGYASLYNLGIENCSGQLICFLDDDCIAEPHWLEKLTEAHLKYPSEIIQGNTFALPKDNIYAQIMGDHYQNWLKSNMINRLELKVLDNKNLGVPREIFEKVGTFSEKQNLGSEDIEFGQRAKKNNVKIIFQPQAIAFHHERDNFKAFVNQHLRIAKSESALDKTAGKTNKVGVLAGKKALMDFWSGIKREINYLKNYQIRNAFLLPIIYLILSLTRLYGYFIKK